MLTFTIYLYVVATGFVDRVTRRLQPDERGQASAEYALVLLGAAAVALLIVGWATHTDLIGKLLDAVINNVTGKVR